MNPIEKAWSVLKDDDEVPPDEVPPLPEGARMISPQNASLAAYIENLRNLSPEEKKSRREEKQAEKDKITEQMKWLLGDEYGEE